MAIPERLLPFRCGIGSVRAVTRFACGEKR